MFSQRFDRSYKSSSLIMLAFGISLVVHGAFVLMTTQNSNFIEPSSPSRLTISMYSINNTVSDDKQVEVLKAPKKDILKASSKLDSQTNKKQKVVETIHHSFPTERITKLESAPSLKSVVQLTETNTKAVLLKSETSNVNVQKKNIKKPSPKKVEKAQRLTQNQPLLSTIDGENQTQAKRYEIGSNNNPKPDYPSIAVKRGWQGQVVLGVYVNPDGSIEHLTFVKSTDYGVLNFEAYETVRTSWHFEALEDKDSLSKPAYIEVPITFNIANR